MEKKANARATLNDRRNAKCASDCTQEIHERSIRQTLPRNHARACANENRARVNKALFAECLRNQCSAMMLAGAPTVMMQAAKCRRKQIALNMGSAPTDAPRAFFRHGQSHFATAVFVTKARKRGAHTGAPF